MYAKDLEIFMSWMTAFCLNMGLVKGMFHPYYIHAKLDGGFIGSVSG